MRHTGLLLIAWKVSLQMTDQATARDENRDESTDDVQRLKPNAVGIVGVLFMAVATAAPITAMVGNVPIAVGFGNGSHAPAGYLFATVVLTLFAIGYATMAKHPPPPVPSTATSPTGLAGSSAWPAVC